MHPPLQPLVHALAPRARQPDMDMEWGKYCCIMPIPGVNKFVYLLGLALVAVLSLALVLMLALALMLCLTFV